MTTYNTYPIVAGATKIPSNLAKINETDVLYYIDGQRLDNVTITDPLTNETSTAAQGIVWGIPKASDLELDTESGLGSWSKDKVSKSQTNKTHGILITEQALCYAGNTSGEGINAAYTVDVEGRRIYGEYYWTSTAMASAIATVINGITIPANQRIDGKILPFPIDGDYTSFTAWKTAGIVEFKEPFKNAIRVQLFKNGGSADPLVVANDSTRSTARFTNCVHATGVFWLNREEAQFRGSSAPDLQFYIEGLKVRSISANYTISTVRAYSTNPALCLLDYLTNTICGAGVPDDDIDLESFYKASQICEQIKVTNVTLEGTFWKNKGGDRSVKLYECNVVLDTSKPIRDNITTILETMNSASLVWSSGKYKLNVAYPNLWESSGSFSALNSSTGSTTDRWYQLNGSGPWIYGTP